MTLSFDHTHDLDLQISSPEFEIAIISRMGWLIDMEWKGCELSIHDHDSSTTLRMSE